MDYLFLIPTFITSFLLFVTILGFTPQLPPGTQTVLSPPTFTVSYPNHPSILGVSSASAQLISSPAPQSTQTPTPTPPCTPDPTPQPTTPPPPSPLNQALNQYRANHGLNPLSPQPPLCQIAQLRAAEAAQNFSHDPFFDHINNHDFDHIDYEFIAENLWQGSSSAPDIIDQWSQSPSHQQNLLGDWTSGCGHLTSDTAAFIFIK